VTGFFDHAAQASLIVAVALLLVAAAACGTQLARVEHAQARRLAQLYLEPLSVWCLAALVTHALAVVAAGNVTFFSLLVPICMGLAAVALRWADDDVDEPADVEVAEPPRPQPEPLTTPVRPASGSLWSRLG
jgi:hypothetical protein